MSKQKLKSNSKKQKSETNKLPSFWGFWVAAIAAGLAAMASLVLAGPKLGLWTSLPGCGPQSGCDAVTNGPLGNIPLGFLVWPVSFVGFAWFVSIQALWANTKGGSGSLLWLIRLGAAGSLGFVVAMLVSGHFCKWCAFVHLSNFVLWIAAEKSIRSTGAVGAKCIVKGFICYFMFVSVVLGAVYMFASSKKTESDKKSSEENLKEIIGAVADSSTLKLLEPGRRFGSEDAPVQVVMFTDYQCPDCKRLETQLARIYRQRSDVSLVVKHFPLNFDCNDEIGQMKMHPNACWSARAAEAAFILGGQDGWERMHTWLFANGGSFTDATFKQDLLVLGFKPSQFLPVMASEETLAIVRASAADGKALGIWFTPMIFINGVEYLWYYGGQDSLAKVIDLVAVAAGVGPQPLISPPSAVEKLIEDWRVGRVFSLNDRGDPSWTGDGDIEIVVWGDYQTEPTRKLDLMLKDVLKSGARAKYSFRHFPIDNECNPNVKNYNTQYPGSCAMARVVEAVDILCGSDARWRVHDAFMSDQTNVSLVGLSEFAATMCTSDPQTIAIVAQEQEVANRITGDIRSKLSVWRRSVPVLVVDGRFVPRWEMDGTTGKETLLRLIEEASK